MNKTNLNDWIVNIGNVSYKFKKDTILKADKAIAHIKKNGNIYKYVVAYIAICLMPSFFAVGKDLIFELILRLSTVSANTPLEILGNSILESVLYLSKIVCIVGLVVSIARQKMISLGTNLKK